MQMTMHSVDSILPTELFMRRERRRLKAKHLLGRTRPAMEQRFREAEYQGHDYQEVQGKWRQTRERYEQSADAQSASLLELSNHFLHFDYADATSWEWIRWQEKSVAQVWHTKQGVYRRKARADVRDEPMQVQQ